MGLSFALYIMSYKHPMLYIIFAIFVIIFRMAEFTWGDMPKSQIDDQLITEAISEAIASHNADPEAHMGEGQSIDIHRKNTIIDHPEQSIVPDKLFGGDIVIRTQFESLDTWNVVGDSFTDGWNGLALPVEYGVTNTSKISGAIYSNGLLFNAISDIYFETQGIWAGSDTDVNAWFGFLSSYTTANNGFGYQVRDGALYAQIHYNTTTDEELLSSIDIEVSHFYMAKYSFADEKVYFFIDSVLVATLDADPGVYWEDDRVPQFGVTLTESNDGTFYFTYLYAWRKVLTS